MFQSNKLRALLAGLAYVLIERLHALALQGTELAYARVDTLRARLLKLAVVVTRNTRRIRRYFASNWPSAPIFRTRSPFQVSQPKSPHRHPRLNLHASRSLTIASLMVC